MKLGVTYISATIISCSSLAHAAQPKMPALPGLTQADITLNLHQFEWEKWTGRTPLSKCGRFEPPSGGLAEVCLYGEPKEIGRVVVNVSNSSDLAESLITYMSTLPFKGSSPSAKAWGVKNIVASRIGKVPQKTILDAIYQLYGNVNTSIFFEIRHPKFESWIEAPPD